MGKDFKWWGRIVNGKKYRRIKGSYEVVNLVSCMKGDGNEEIKVSNNCATAPNKYIRWFTPEWGKVRI